MTLSRTLRRLAAVCAASALLGGCLFDQKYLMITPQLDQQLTAQLVSGQATLDCQINCSLTWMGNLQSLAQRDAQGDWHGLAMEVFQIGYASDLAYYYLGRAARGMGADAAAIRYFQYAGGVSTGNNSGLKCGNFGGCNGVAMPSVLVPAIQEANLDLQRQQLRTALSEPAPELFTPTAVHHKAAPVHHAATASSQAAPADTGFVVPPPVTR